MKNLPILINVSLCLVLVAVLVIFGLPSAQAKAAQPAQETATPIAQETTSTAQGCDTTRTVQVNGSAEVKVIPDRVLITMGVQSNATKIAEVETANTEAMERILAALTNMKVASEDISTNRYIIEPVYGNYDSLNIKGYRINNNVAITLRDVSKTSALISSVLKAGANQVINVEFYTSELRKYRDQARDMAVKAAQEKAQALSRSAGAETGCVIHINENTWSSYYGGFGGAPSTQNVIQNVAPQAGAAGAMSDDGPVSLGKISVQATVDMTFALK